MKQANLNGIAIHNRAAGERFDFGGASFEILAPPADANLNTQRDNDDSMVMKIAFGSASALLEGDAERKTERAIAPALGPVSLLKVAHHGSATSSIPALLSQIQPQFAVISVGKFNRYGHPSNAVLERLSQEGACAFRTDWNGAVSFYLKGSGVTSAQWGRERVTMKFPPNWTPPLQAGHCAALR